MDNQEQVQTKAPQPTLKDAPWIFLSVAIWLTSFILFGTWHTNVDFGSEFEKLVSSLIVSVIIASVLGLFWVVVMRCLKKSIVKVSLIATPVVYVLWGIYIMIEWGANPAFYFVVAAIYAIWGYIRRDRIPFVTALLDAGTTCLSDLPSILYIQIVSVLLNIGWAVFFVFFFAFGWKYVNPETWNQFTSFFFVVYACYTLCTAINTFTSHVIACGSVATWWLAPQNGSPVCDTAVRTIRYSFGSISLGAFIVTVLETIQLAIGWFFDTPCLRWCWRGFKNLVKLFSSYAFVRVAVYGDSFCEGSNATAKLFKEKGMDGITSDTFIWAVITLGAWFLGAVHGGITILIMMAYGYIDTKTDTFILYLLWLAGLWIGKAMIIATLQPVESAVRTTFVLWATPGNEETMKQNHPELFGAIIAGAVGPYALAPATPVMLNTVN